LPPQLLHFLLKRGMVERPANSHNHVIQIKGLGHEVIGTKLNSIDRIVARAMGRDDQCGEIDEPSFFAKETLRVREHAGTNPKLYITIADTGIGMSREASRRIGELFYTTKGESGTGLGMWVSQQILRKYGGSLQAFRSTRTGSSGTIFRLRFSISRESGKTAAGNSFQPAVLQPQKSKDERREDEPGTEGKLAKSA
jgi:hypothetical protein